MNVPLESSGLRFEPETPARLHAMIDLLAAVGLPADDLGPTNLAGFELAIDPAGDIVGLAGLEELEGGALLRSVAVVPQWRARRLGEALQ